MKDFGCDIANFASGPVGVIFGTLVMLISIHACAILAVTAALEVVASGVVGWTSLKPGPKVWMAPLTDPPTAERSGDLVAWIEEVAFGHDVGSFFFASRAAVTAATIG